MVFLKYFTNEPNNSIELLHVYITLSQHSVYWLMETQLCHIVIQFRNFGMTGSTGIHIEWYKGNNLTGIDVAVSLLAILYTKIRSASSLL